MSHLRGDARKRACTCPGASTSEHCPTHVDPLAGRYTASDQRADTAFLVGVNYGRSTANFAAVLTAAADDLNQHAHTFADTLTPTDYARADLALRQIGINLRDITNAAWHLALLDAAGRVRETAIHEATS